MEKTKRIVASILALSLLFLCVACDNETVKMEKWVLVEEKNVLVMENGVEETQYEKSYGYDSFGRKIFEKQNDHGEISNCSDFQYDNKGNMISCLVTVTVNEDIVNTYSNSYSYDSNNNLLEYSSKGSDFTTQIQYQYNEKGYMIYEEQSYISDSYERTEFVKYTPYFENDVCIQSEIARTFSDLEGTNYWLDKYSYDENGNMISVHQYIETEKDNSNIEHNGRYYQLSYITYYTYEEITVEELVVENSYDVTLNNANENIGYEETTTEAQKRLSEDCDMILCTGYDGEDYYELVANQVDNYPRSSILVGVIKNNTWLIELSSQSPFLNEDSWWKTSQYYEKIQDKFIYLDEGCFLMKNDGIDDYHSVIYKPDTNISFAVAKMSIGIYYSDDYSKIINDDKFIAVSTDWKLTVYDMSTGNSDAIKGFFSDDSIHLPNSLQGISDGLFYARGDTSTWHNFDYVQYEGFFDLNGNMIIDLSNYSISKSNGYLFTQGKYTMTVKNENGVNFDITFDTSGQIVSQEKSAVQ